MSNHKYVERYAPVSNRAVQCSFELGIELQPLLLFLWLPFLQMVVLERGLEA